MSILLNPEKAELQVAGKAAAAALQNTVYELLSETFSNEYQIGFQYEREAEYRGKGIIGFSGKKYDRTCGSYCAETGVFTAQQKGVYGEFKKLF